MRNPGGSIRTLGKFLLLLAPLVVPGSLAGDELWVELVETTGLPGDASRALLAEVDAVYSKAGVAIRWLEAAPPEARPHVARVYLMSRLPRSLDARLRAFGGPAMALALGSEADRSGAVIYVSREAVLHQATGGAAREPELPALGRALGRVVAHELAHRFLGRRHTRRGILSASLHGGDLTSARDALFFTKRQRERLRRLAWTPRAVAAP